MIPLSYSMKPKTLSDIYGQEHLIGENKILSNLIKKDILKSLIFYGPPGTGKTSLANVIANATNSEFYQINAVNSGKKDIEEIIKNKNKINKKITLFIDEIHRFNKLQQDYLLPYIESGEIILIGATTENPYFEVNKALLSRSLIFELKPLTIDNLICIIKKTLSDIENGYGKEPIVITDEAIKFIAQNSSNDARIALNLLELSVLTTKKNNGKIYIDENIIINCLQKKPLKYDKDGQMHYDIISAFIKSMRGSDPNATVYYLACMLEAGEDINFIARIIVICASEDVGLADPKALEIATNALLAVKTIGMPESRIILSNAALYIALAPKSNSSYIAINKAIDFVRKNGIDEVPVHLKQSGYNYKYPHDGVNHIIKQKYLPTKINEKFYEFSNINYEKTLEKYHKDIENNNIK